MCRELYRDKLLRILNSKTFLSAHPPPLFTGHVNLHGIQSATGLTFYWAVGAHMKLTRGAEKRSPICAPNKVNASAAMSLPNLGQAESTPGLKLGGTNNSTQFEVPGFRICLRHIPIFLIVPRRNHLRFMGYCREGSRQAPATRHSKAVDSTANKFPLFLYMSYSGSRSGRRVTFRHEPGEFVMSTVPIRPSTLDGIKRLAKSLKNERNVQHVRALDDAAKEAGFQNFRHASNVLRTASKPESPHSSHRIFLTAYWKDSENGTNGRETLTIWLLSRWGDLIKPLQFQNHRALVNFRAEGPDHLAREQLLRTQSGARRAVCAAARALHFMDATGLRPSKSHSRAFPGGRSSNAIPGCDHYSVWYDRETKRYLFVDEPYEKAVENKVQEREAWAKQHGFAIVKPEWTGMYAPDVGSRLYLVADQIKGILLQPVAAALNKLPTPILESAWDGESVPMTPFFVSPGTIAKASAEKDKPKVLCTPSNGQRNSVNYIQTFVGTQRRPKGRMPIEAHMEVGQLLKSVLADSYHRKGVYNRVNAIRSELDEWTQREYNHAELPNDQFFDLYYHESASTFSRLLTAAERERHAKSLAQAKKLLGEHYPDCPPLRSLSKKMDAAIKSMQSWV